MEKEELEQLVENVVQRTAPLAINEALIRFGIDASDPIKIQRNMAFLDEHRQLVESDDWKNDMAHLRSWRNIWETVKSNGFIATILAGVGAILAWIGTHTGLHLGQ